MAAGSSPASSSASKTVVARGETCSPLMPKTVSRSAWRAPTARIAEKDEPYSTTRCSPRWYQTRCGMWWTSGNAPVAIEVRQTGVSDGKTLVPRPLQPASARAARAGSLPSSRPRSSASGVSPSTTTRTTFFRSASVRSVFGKNSEACVALVGLPTETRARDRRGHGRDVAEGWDRRQDERAEGGGRERLGREAPEPEERE